MPGHPWYALIQADDSAADAPLADMAEAALAAAVADGVALDVVVAQSVDQAGKLWALRENISEAQRREGPNIKHDISLPVSAIPAFMVECGAELAARISGIAPGGVRTPGRRQPALQPVRARGRGRGVVPGERGAPRTGSSTTWSRVAAEASARSTAWDN